MENNGNVTAFEYKLYLRCVLPAEHQTLSCTFCVYSTNSLNVCKHNSTRKSNAFDSDCFKLISTRMTPCNAEEIRSRTLNTPTQLPADGPVMYGCSHGLRNSVGLGWELSISWVVETHITAALSCQRLVHHHPAALSSAHNSITPLSTHRLAELCGERWPANCIRNTWVYDWKAPAEQPPSKAFNAQLLLR